MVTPAPFPSSRRRPFPIHRSSAFRALRGNPYPILESLQKPTCNQIRGRHLYPFNQSILSSAPGRVPTLCSLKIPRHTRNLHTS